MSFSVNGSMRFVIQKLFFMLSVIKTIILTYTTEM